MGRRFITLLLLWLLSIMAIGSLTWGGFKALGDSADLLKRAEEVDLFLRGEDPYDDPDMTYPPTALPVFTPLAAPFAGRTLKAFWVGLNLAALATFCGTCVSLCGRNWPRWLQLAFCLVVAGSKPVRAGIALGQFHLIPTLLALSSIFFVRRGRPIVAGLLFGVALVKPTMVLPLLGLLAIRRCWTALATAAAVQAVLLIGVSAWLRIGPSTLIEEWLAKARGQEASGAIDLPSLLNRNWPNVPMSTSLVSLMVLLTAFAMVVRFRRSSDITLAAFCFTIAAVFTYHRHYDLVLLLPTLAVLIEAARKRGRTRADTFRLASAAVFFAVMVLIPSDPLSAPFRRAYEQFFVIASYSYLLLVIVLLVVETKNPEVV